jgi:putative restriction endonuclease
MSGRAWSLLAVKGKRRYAGNEGYSDDPARLYRYDSTVGNSRHIATGDLAVIRDTAGLVGMGRIADVRSSEGKKQRFRCPVCDIATIKQHKSGLFRCDEGHTFEDPKVETIPVTRYEAEYGTTWTPLDGVMNAAILREVTLGSGTQNSIRKIDGPKFAGRIAALRPDARPLLSMFLQECAPGSADESDDAPDGFAPSLEDRRVTILRAIRVRRGQPKFRNGLIGRYGARCMVTECEIMEIVEAAHIWPYRGEQDNALSNGLLLRSDLHTLYDCDLVGIHPVSFAVSIAPALKGTIYADLQGKCIDVASHRPNDEALRLRWKAFQEASAGSLSRSPKSHSGPAWTTPQDQN